MAQQYWEYKFVQLAISRGFKINIYRPYSVNDKKLENWDRGPSWQEYFVEQGAEGWEFVAFDELFLTDTVAGGKMAIFKRLRIPDPAPEEEQKEDLPKFKRIDQPQNRPPFIES